jgi:uncharacterized SAM-binding protein YcdF (DUF218 family)
VFFVLSKLLVFLIRPLTWILICGCWALFTQNQKRRKSLILASMLLLFLFGNGVVFNTCARAWEEQPDSVAIKSKMPYEAAIVLGGYAFWDAGRNRAQLSAAGDRLYYPLALYHQKQVRKLLLSGGSGSLMQRLRSEALYSREMLLHAGVNDSNMLLESSSRNTFENAQFSKKLSDSAKLKGPYLLVTSASHMPRAMACFKKAGMECIPYPVHFLSRTSGSYELKDWILPSTEILYHWEVLIKEWVGMIAYKLSGKI